MTALPPRSERRLTAAEMVRNIDVRGKRAVVTGAGGGIGVEICRAFAGAGADVTMAVRDTGKAAAAAEEIRKAALAGTVSLRQLDVADAFSVQRFVANWTGKLDILVNNAGIMMLPDLQHTPDGWELQFATNYVGHARLAIGLQQALTSASGARVIFVSSSAHLFSPVIYDDPAFAFVPYDPLIAYAQSKTAGILFCVEASARWKDRGITANAVMPGAVATNLQQHTGGLRTPAHLQKTPQQGAATVAWAATAAHLGGTGGRYYEDLREAPVVDSRSPDLTGVARYALDPGNACRLWDLTKLPPS